MYCTVHGYPAPTIHWSKQVMINFTVHGYPVPTIHWSKQVMINCTVHGYTVPTVHWSKKVTINCTVYMYTMYLLYIGLNTLVYTVQGIPCTNCVHYTIKK